MILGILGITVSVYGQNRNPADTFPGTDNETILSKWKAYGEPIFSEAADVWFEWAWNVVWEIEGINDFGITDNASAREVATNLVKWFLNYVLWLIGLVAMVYLLYHGFLALTAWANDEQSAKWISGIKYAIVAIFGLALSWFIVSLILYVIFLASSEAL